VGAEVELKATPQREDKARSVLKAGRKAIASHLRRVPILYELPESERQCACPGCEQCVKSAPLPPQILPKTNASPGMAAHVVTSKFVDALPFYRQEVIFERHGVRLPRSTQAAWIIALAERVQPLINLMDERLRESGYLRMDETPVQVLKSDKAATAEHYMWIRVAGPARARIILFDYDASRGAIRPTMWWPSARTQTKGRCSCEHRPRVSQQISRSDCLVDHLRLGELLQSFLTHLRAEAGLLGAAERHIDRQI
jgi:transposase